MRPLHSARNHLWLVAILLGLATVVAGVFLPLYRYYQLLQDPETRMRVGHFTSLLAYGPLGRHLARIYARDSFHGWRGYGFHYVRTQGVVLPGASAEDVDEVLGPPDLHATDHDIWWVSRDAIGKRMLSGSAEGDGLRSDEWNRRIVAEYDQDGSLLRLFVPKTRFMDEAQDPAPERSPPPVDQPPPESQPASRTP